MISKFNKENIKGLHSQIKIPVNYAVLLKKIHKIFRSIMINAIMCWKCRLRETKNHEDVKLTCLM